MSTAKTKSQLRNRFDEQRGLCCYCDRPAWLPHGHYETKEAARARLGIVKGARGAAKALRDRMATREHLKRVVDGGTDANANIAMACGGCNARRGDMEAVAYRAHVQALIAAGEDWWSRYLAKAARFPVNCGDWGRQQEPAWGADWDRMTRVGR